MLLEHARQEAEDTSRLKSEFIARVTHELRTPMHGVLGIAALLERSGLNDNQLRFLDTLQRSGRHMVDLIDGLLTISTIESGDIVIETHRERLDLLIEDTFALLRPIADEKNLTFECDCNFSVREALADGTRLTQIVVNLLTNALKFTEDGEVQLRAETIPQAERLLLRLDVSDTGVGIPQGKLTQIFDKFTQLRGVRGVCSEGVGLGLSITQSLTELMGGRMSVTSTEGAGSVFTVEIPLEYVSADFRALDGCDLSPVTLPRQSHPLRQ
jgi:signal transduction histidine kinase